MTWQSVKLRGLCTKIGSGATPHGGASVYIDEGTSLIRSQNVYNIKFEYDGLAHITADAAKKLDGVTVESGDVLLNITGDSVARTCIVPDNVLPARVNQHVAIIRANPELLDYRYLNYYLASPAMQAHMLGLAVGKGASRNAITKAMIEDFSIPLPPLPVQRRIADILSTYDNLIKNNRKQIKLLEEAAQRLYREWFIDLRFPGHEHTPVINGIPEGWGQKCFGDIFTYERGRSYTSDEISDSAKVLLVNLKNIKAWGGYNRDAEKHFAGAVKQSQLLSHDDIVMAVTDMTQERRLVGHVALIPRLPLPATFSMDLRRIIPKELPNLFLYAVLLFGDYGAKVSLLANGTNVLHLKPDAMMSQIMLIPPVRLVDKYVQQFSVIRGKIENLEGETCDCIEARDRLLPQLMNSTIEALP